MDTNKCLTVKKKKVTSQWNINCKNRIRPSDISLSIFVVWYFINPSPVSLQPTSLRSRSCPTLAEVGPLASAARVEHSDEGVVGGGEEEAVEGRVGDRVEGGDSRMVDASLLVACFGVPNAQGAVPWTGHHLVRILLPDDAGDRLFVPIERPQRDLERRGGSIGRVKTS